MPNSMVLASPYSCSRPTGLKPPLGYFRQLESPSTVPEMKSAPSTQTCTRTT